MTISLKMAGHTFARRLVAPLPEPEGLRILHLLYGSQGAAIINLADPTGDVATVTGAPTWSATKVVLDHNNYLTLPGGGSTLEMTLMSVHRKPASGDHAFLSNFTSPTSGEGLWYDDGGGTPLVRATNNPNHWNAVGMAALVGTDWYMQLVTYDAWGSVQWIGHGGRLYGPFGTAGDRDPLASEAFRAGRGAGTALTTQAADHMMLAIWDRALNRTQAWAPFRYAQAIAQALSITHLSLP